MKRRAQILGTGLIGGSLGLALRAAGWHVSGFDNNAQECEAALSKGCIDVIGDDLDASLVFVAVPAAVTAAVVLDALAKRVDNPGVIVSDVAGVKGDICEAVSDERFIGGHPMAGSEQHGIAGAREDLFLSTTWVLTPRQNTSPDRFADLMSVILEIGASVIALEAHDHDRLVALISHVPHLVAASLMNEAAVAAESDAALLQLAAGGFRDMTRIAAGHPGIWPDVCFANATAILKGLGDLTDRLAMLSEAIAKRDRAALTTVLSSASVSRRALPGRTSDPDLLSQVRIPVPDRPGVIAEVATAASELGVSMVDLEIAHSIEGGSGVLIVVVNRDEVDRFQQGLSAIGFSSTTQVL
jgi:prephenate dehydrogenase